MLHDENNINWQFVLISSRQIEKQKSEFWVEFDVLEPKLEKLDYCFENLDIMYSLPD